MNEEEAIKTIEELKNYISLEMIDINKPKELTDLFAKSMVAFQVMKNAYNKEKEKNKNAIKYIKEISPLEVGRAPNGKMMYDHNLNQDEIYGLLEILEEE